MSKEVYRRLSKAERKLENTNRLRTNNTTLRIKYEGIKKLLEKKDKEIEKLKEQNKALNEMYELTKKEYISLNNIINGMEKFFEYSYDNEVRPLNDRKVSVWTICLDILQELKGSDK